MLTTKAAEKQTRDGIKTLEIRVYMEISTNECTRLEIYVARRTFGKINLKILSLACVNINLPLILKFFFPF